MKVHRTEASESVFTFSEIPIGPEAVGDGPGGTGMQWRIRIVSSLTITSLARSRTIRCRSRTSRVSAADRKQCQEQPCPPLLKALGFNAAELKVDDAA